MPRSTWILTKLKPSTSTARRSLLFALVLSLALLGLQGEVTTSASVGCASPSLLVAEQGGATIGIDPRTHGTQLLSVSPDLAGFAMHLRTGFWRVLPHQWQVMPSSRASGTRVQIANRSTGATVFDVAFRRQIEIASLAISPTARYTLYIQSNNEASEVTVLDAETGTQRLVRIPHHATLAAYAIGTVFDPAERCVAISMQRADRPGAESWLVDLDTGDVSPVPLPDLWVLDWVPTPGRPGEG